MKVLCDGMRVVSKNMREGENDKGAWVLYECECSTGEGSIANLLCSEEIYTELVPFEEITAEIELSTRRYRLNGEITAFYK